MADSLDREMMILMMMMMLCKYKSDYCDIICQTVEYQSSLLSGLFCLLMDLFMFSVAQIHKMLSCISVSI